MIKLKKNSSKIIVAFVILLFIIIDALVLRVTVFRPHTTVDQSLKAYSAQDLAPFDGTDPNKPIYIGLNGLVYDVSTGREFYQTGGPYHDLAGKDSSGPLNIIGGAIIARKYPVIGRLVTL